MSPTPPLPSSTASPDSSTVRRWLEWAFAIIIISVIAVILIPSVGSNPPGKNQKTFALLSNLVSMCRMYHQEYHQWPVFSQPPSGSDYFLSLKNNSPRFVQIMTGNLSAHPELAKYNHHGTQFASFSLDEHSPDGSRVIDAYGNDDLVLVMDTSGSGVIAPFTVNVTAASGQSFTFRQTTPIHASIVALSPGRGQSDSDFVTTWSQ